MEKTIITPSVTNALTITVMGVLGFAVLNFIVAAIMKAKARADA